MRIVFVSRWFSHGMGYIENCLPQALVSLGHEVHLITSTAQVYYNVPFYEKTYGVYLGKPVLEAGEYKDGNVTLHRLPFRHVGEHMVLKGLVRKIRALRPDVVQVFEHTAIDTYRVALFRLFSRFAFFTGNHSVLSVFPMAKNWENISWFRKVRWKVLNEWPGRLVSRVMEKCYVVTADAGTVATRFMGVAPRKISVSILGVDTSLYFPPREEDRQALKMKHGFMPHDIVCLYSGRFTNEKNPLIVARAVEELADGGLPLRGLFVGEGEQRVQIENTRHCKVVPFVPYLQLPEYYQSADIGVWPGQESTSQLDAVSSGLTLVLTDAIKAYAPIESDDPSETRPKIVSRFYHHFDKEHLKMQIKSLLDAQVRAELAGSGAAEISTSYSWLAIARRRIEDYEAALR